MNLVIKHRSLSTYEQAVNELLEGIPGLAQMSHTEGMAAIDKFTQDWKNPSLSFNPWRYFALVKHEQAVAQTVAGW